MVLCDEEPSYTQLLSVRSVHLLSWCLLYAFSCCIYYQFSWIHAFSPVGSFSSFLIFSATLCAFPSPTDVIS